MLTEEMQMPIRNFSAGSVATINANGTPAVSPAEFILSPAYDRGLTEDEMRTANLERLNALS